MKFDVVIKSIDNLIHHSKADEVILPALYGKVGVRPNHANTSVILTKGEIVIKKDNQQEAFAINNGIAQIKANKIDILLT
jgi:F0F1-type ATP synthase epsilon subunit